MLEVERQSLMATIGLRALQPRFILSGAKPSNMIVEEALADKLAITTPTADVIPESKISTAISSFVSPSALFKDDNKSVRLSPVADIEPQHIITSTAAIRCRYRLVRVGELLLFFDQTSPEWQDMARAKVFFADLYFSLCHKKYEYWADMQFDWPPLKNFPNANDKAVIQQALTMFVDAQLTQPPCKWLLLFGESSAKYLLDKPLNVGETDFFNELPVLMLEQYQQYWSSPYKKALLWQYMQVIKKSLADNAAM